MGRTLRVPSAWTFDSDDVAEHFDQHVREQLPWYELATNAVATVVRQYLGDGGLVYDLGASTGNIGRALEPTLRARGATLVALEKSPNMAKQYRGPGTLEVADLAEYVPPPHDVAVAFLTFMFVPPNRRAQVIDRWLGALRPGGALVIVDRTTPPGGYPSSVFARLTWEAKRASGTPADDIIAKELSLSGVQRPLDPHDLADRDAVEFFRYADFAGYLLEAR